MVRELSAAGAELGGVTLGFQRDNDKFMHRNKELEQPEYECVMSQQIHLKA